jgi:hypothetical protein
MVIRAQGVLKRRTPRFSETPLHFYQATLRHISDKGNLHTHRCQNLRSLKVHVFEGRLSGFFVSPCYHQYHWRYQANKLIWTNKTYYTICIHDQVPAVLTVLTILITIVLIILTTPTDTHDVVPYNHKLFC